MEGGRFFSLQPSRTSSKLTLPFGHINLRVDNYYDTSLLLLFPGNIDRGSDGRPFSCKAFEPNLAKRVKEGRTCSPRMRIAVMINDIVCHVCNRKIRGLA